MLLARGPSSAGRVLESFAIGGRGVPTRANRASQGAAERAKWYRLLWSCGRSEVFVVFLSHPVQTMRELLEDFFNGCCLPHE